MIRSIAFALALIFAASTALAQDRAELDSISVHLFLTKSGILSDDVTAMDGFSALNFKPDGPGIPEGECFYSILIKVRFTAPDEIFAKGRQAEITVRDWQTKKIIRRERISNVYIGPHGWTVLPVFVANAACGPFDIVARGYGKQIVKTLEAACGE